MTKDEMKDFLSDKDYLENKRLTKEQFIKITEHEDFDEAMKILKVNHSYTNPDVIWSLKDMKDFIKEQLDNNDLFYARHLITAVSENKDSKWFYYNKTDDTQRAPVSLDSVEDIERVNLFRNEKEQTMEIKEPTKEEKITKMFDDLFAEVAEITKNDSDGSLTPEKYVKEIVIPARDKYFNDKGSELWWKYAIHHAVNSGGYLWQDTHKRVELFEKYGLVPKGTTKLEGNAYDKIADNADKQYGEYMCTYLSSKKLLSEKDRLEAIDRDNGIVKEKSFDPYNSLENQNYETILRVNSNKQASNYHSLSSPLHALIIDRENKRFGLLTGSYAFKGTDLPNYDMYKPVTTDKAFREEINKLVKLGYKFKEFTKEHHKDISQGNIKDWTKETYERER